MDEVAQDEAAPKPENLKQHHLARREEHGFCVLSLWHLSMYDPDSAIRIVVRAWLGFLGVIAVFGIAAYTRGTGERREANRRLIRKSLNGSGWMLLSFTLKYVGFAFPRAEPH